MNSTNEKLNEAVRESVSEIINCPNYNNLNQKDVISIIMRNIQPLFDELQKENQELREICDWLLDKPSCSCILSSFDEDGSQIWGGKRLIHKCDTCTKHEISLKRYQTLKQNGEKKDE